MTPLTVVLGNPPWEFRRISPLYPAFARMVRDLEFDVSEMALATVLQRVHKGPSTARLALGVAAGRERASRLFAGVAVRPLSGVVVKLGVRLSQMAGVRTAKRVFAKVIPGAKIMLGTWVNSAATRDLADRARCRYREAAPVR
jgi:hypothetical protein